MNPNKNRYFIGIVPPQLIYEQAFQLKEYFRDRYQSKGALNAPPHITLHMPFEWKPDKEEILVASLVNLAKTLFVVRIALTGFGCFAPRVIFISVPMSNDLSSLHQKVRLFCRNELGLLNTDYKDLPFHPHLTLAFRDLKKPAFAKAWEEFKDKPYSENFLADRLCLLKHDGKNWQVFREFALSVFNH